MLAAAMIFNFFICNMDAHGKNFSLLHTDESQLGLAPFYDMLCTRFYPSLTAKMAMKVGSQYEANRILPRHWEQLCEDIHYSYPALKQLIKKQGESIITAIEGNKQFYIEMTHHAHIINNITKIITNNIIQTLKQFD